jgi:hypothetical protein
MKASLLPAMASHLSGIAPMQRSLLQRKCACGGTPGLDGECAECRKKQMTLQRSAANRAEPETVPPIVHEVLRSPGQPLEPATHAFMEPRFGHDFSQVRIHSHGAEVMQRKLTIGASNDPLEQEADRVADQILAAPAHAAVSGAPPHIQRYTGQATGQADSAPASVGRVLASPGRPLDPALKQDMGQRFGHDFFRVRVHSGTVAEQSARDVNANAYTSGYDIVFGAGRFAPGTVEGRRLLAHELTHVVQQTRGGGSDPAVSIQRDVAGSGQFLAPFDLVKTYLLKMLADHFDGIADRLVSAISSHPSPSKYVLDVFEVIAKINPNLEDNLGAEFIKRLSNTRLDQFAATKGGRYMLNVVYAAIITGSVTAFEREQANRIIKAKLLRIAPEDYIKGAKQRIGGAPTPIFPVRFMRVTPGYDYAPPLAKLMPNGRVRVSYPVAVKDMSMFKEEVRTLPNVFGGEGEEFHANEIVGIKDYEKGGNVDVQYLPALALIDYSNQAIESTSGKIVEVSLFAATMGIGGGAAAGGGVVATEVRMTAIWAARLAKTARVLDPVANFIGIASFVINENRDWIISKLGGPGKRLVQLSDIANSAAVIYGIGRLGQAGHKIVKDMRAASKAAREQAKRLTQEEAVILKRLDDETDAMLRQVDDEAAKSGRATAPTPAEKPAVSGHVDDPAAAKVPAKAETSAPGRPAGKPAGAPDEITASASRIGISRQTLDGEIGDLRKQTANPNKVRQPKDAKLDAEMTSGRNKFDRNKNDRTWCRHSDGTCDLKLGAPLNADVDGALAKKQAKFAAIEQQRKAREASPPRARDPKREPAAKAQTDPTPEVSKARVRAKQQVEKANTKKALQSQIDDAKELEHQLRHEIDALEQSGKQRLNDSERAALAAEKAKLENNLLTKIDERQRLRKTLDDLEITPYDRARAFSYSDAAAEEVIGRARKVVDVPGQPKRVALVDEMSGKPIKERSIDHVVPIDDIVRMKGYGKLKLPEQEALLSRVDNLRMMEKGANSSKGTKRWADWREGRWIYREKVWREMIAEEARLRRALEDKIIEILAARGQKP